MFDHPTTTEVPLSAEEHANVLAQLDLIVRSTPFRSSKRYPAMLEHCVRLTLAGEFEKLRERQLGITLFARSYGYDTSADPIVRMAASEIRKRLAQFYDHAGEQASVRISLPPGSYVAEFKFASLAEASAIALNAEPESVEEPKEESKLPVLDFPVVHAIPESTRPKLSAFKWLSIAAGLILVGVCAYLLYIQHKSEPFPVILNGAFSRGNQVAVVVGQLPVGNPVAAQQAETPLSADIFRTDRFLSIGDAGSTLQICGILARGGSDCQLKPAKLVDLSSLHNRSALLIGAYNNPWTLRLAASLPYRFGPNECRCILEAKTSNNLAGVDFSLPRGQITTDYSIVARFHSDVIDAPAVIIAGIGPMGMEAAAEFSVSADRSKELLALAPKGWNGGSVEAVLATDLVNGIPGHTRILKTAFW